MAITLVDYRPPNPRVYAHHPKGHEQRRPCRDSDLIKQAAKEVFKGLPKYFNLQPSNRCNLKKFIDTGYEKLLQKDQHESLRAKEDTLNKDGENPLNLLEQHLKMKGWANREHTEPN